MSMTTAVGLAWICFGLATLGLGRLIEGSLARGYLRKHPDGDVARYMHGKILYKRVFAGVLIAAGGGVFIYGLLGGGSGQGKPAEINNAAVAIAIAALCVTVGVMILLRNRFARSIMGRGPSAKGESFEAKGSDTAKRKWHDDWVLYLIPPTLFASFLVWLMRDVWHWF